MNVAGTPHPLSPRYFPSVEAFTDFCAEHFPFGCKDEEEAAEQLAYSRQQVEIHRACGQDAKAHEQAVRNGEAYFRALRSKRDGEQARAA
jgi:hypothetical protein